MKYYVPLLKQIKQLNKHGLNQNKTCSLFIKGYSFLFFYNVLKLYMSLYDTQLTINTNIISCTDDLWVRLQATEIS